LICAKADIRVSNTVAFDKFDVAVNAAPVPDTLLDGIHKLNKGGRYCLFSGFIKNVNIPSGLLNEVHYRQLTITGAYGSTKRQMETALKILETNVQTVRLLIHKIINLESVPEALPEILSGQVLKYVVDLQKGE